MHARGSSGVKPQLPTTHWVAGEGVKRGVHCSPDRLHGSPLRIRQGGRPTELLAGVRAQGAQGWLPGHRHVPLSIPRRQVLAGGDRGHNGCKGGCGVGSWEHKRSTSQSRQVPRRGGQRRNRLFYR